MFWNIAVVCVLWVRWCCPYKSS